MQIEGEGIERDASNFIYPVKGYSPQIGILVAMLNNLSERVEKAVKGMDKRGLDFLLDERANSIGALVLHLAAAEAYYQVYTFENRESFLKIQLQCCHEACGPLLLLNLE